MTSTLQGESSNEQPPQQHREQLPPPLLSSSSSSSSSSEYASYIPIIDLSPLHDGSMAGKQKVAQAIKLACEDVGFFIITHHGVPPSIIHNAWAAATEFFDLPTEEKEKSVKMEGSQYPYGYSGFGGEVLSHSKAYEHAHHSSSSSSSSSSLPPSLPDPKESFSIGPSDPASGMPAVRWPPSPPSFAPAIAAYYQAMETLSSSLLELFALALSLPPSFFTSLMIGHCSALRLLNYPPLPPSFPPSLRASPHTDYGILTLLRSGGRGLEVLRRREGEREGGGEWVAVPEVGDSFVVNLGDLMGRWTNDWWVSTMHRVVEEGEGEGGGKRRQTMAFFCNLPARVMVECLETCRREGEAEPR
ncbi:hypothetical protein VYU27_008809 [Nannochloropsis oceanica]